MFCRDERDVTLLPPEKRDTGVVFQDSCIVSSYDGIG